MDSLTTVSIFDSWSVRIFFTIPSLLLISSWRTITPSEIESILLSKERISCAKRPVTFFTSFSAFNLDSIKLCL